MSKKEDYVGRKITFYYRDGIHQVEAIIKDINASGILMEIINSRIDFYEIGCEYFVPFATAKFVYKFL